MNTASKFVVLTAITLLGILPFRAFALNAKDYGAVGDGSTLDRQHIQDAINALPAAGGEVFIPAGTYRLDGPLDLSGTGISLRGEGKSATTLKPDSTASSALLLGGSYIFYGGKVSDLHITRASGDAAANHSLCGIFAQSFSYAVIDDVTIDSQGVGLKTGAGFDSVGLILNGVKVHNSFRHVWLVDVAETYITSCSFGLNAPEDNAPEVILLLDGKTNDVRVKTTQFIPKKTPNSTVAVQWANFPPLGTPGYYRFEDINLERIATGFQSDSTFTRIQSLQVTNSRLTSSGKMFDFAAATLLTDCSINNNSFSIGADSTINHPQWSRFSNNFVGGHLIFNGGNAPGGDIIINANTFATTAVFTGDFEPLVLTNNSLVYNNSAHIALDTSAATGRIMMTGNAADADPQPITRSP